MTKRVSEKGTKDAYLLLLEKKTYRALAPPVLKKGTFVQFELCVPYIPRLCGYYQTKAALTPDIVIIYLATLENGVFSKRVKVGEFDFTTVDLEEILPSQQTAKLKPVKEEESEEKGEEDDDEDESADASSSKSSSSVDDPNDKDYKELTVSERIAACREDTIYWQPEKSPWEFKFPVVREPAHLMLSHVALELVKKKKAA